MPTTRTLRRGVTPVLMAGLLLLTSCGGGSTPTSPSSVALGQSVLPSPVTPPSVSAALTIDFLNVANYAARPLPSHYDAAVTRLDNAPGPIDDRVATLGRVLFYDRRLSVNDSTSCASCHQQALGFSDARQFSIGAAGVAVTPSHSMRLGNARFYAPGQMFWDKRALSLEAQASIPITDPREMGFTAGFGALVAKMNGIAYYPDLFAFAFGTTEITEQRIQTALAQFQRAMVSSSSRWDTAYAQVFTPGGTRNLDVDLPGFSPMENQGRALFMGGARGPAACSDCHVPPTFALDATAGGIGLDAGETRAFKAPSLKNVALTGPYMHDGRFASLEQVLAHYNNGIQPGPALDSRLRGAGGGVRTFALSPPERAALVAFLRTLNDVELTTDPRFSDPFRQ